MFPERDSVDHRTSANSLTIRTKLRELVDLMRFRPPCRIPRYLIPACVKIKENYYLLY